MPTSTVPPGPLNLIGNPPSSNIMLLPQLGGMTFSIVNNAGWYDVILFTSPANSEAPLDISGIDFHAELRVAVGDAQNWLDMSTSPAIGQAQFVNGAITGQLFFSVDVSLIVKLSPRVYVMDMIATDITSKMVKSLCEVEPIQVMVIQGVTR
jgi:hypothetical protein